MKSICVFCGSRPGATPEFKAAAIRTGEIIAKRGWKLVYGGGSVGLMGAVANTVLEKGGDVLGVIPEFLATREVMHTGVSELKIVPSMHLRKAWMAEESDAFLALPGGYGTLEELFEVITWSQLGLHRKPIGVLNTAGFFTPLLEFLDRAIREGFIRDNERRHLIVGEDPDLLLNAIEASCLPESLSEVMIEKA